MKFFAFVAAAAVAACSTDTFVASDAGDAGGDDGGALDATPDAADGGAADACAPIVACPVGSQCADFDDGTEAPFADSSQGSGCSTQVSGDRSVSCPKSLASVLQPLGASPARGIATLGLATASVTELHTSLDFWVWLPANPTGVFTAAVIRASSNDAVELAYNSGWSLFDTAKTKGFTIDPLVGAWNHMVLDVVFSTQSNTGSATLTYTDSSGHQAAPAKIADSTLAQSGTILTGVTYAIGLDGVDVQTTTTAYYDSVIVTKD